MGQHTHSMGAVQSSSSAQSQFDITVVDRATEQEHRLAVNPCEDIAESLQHSLGKFRVTRVVYGDSDVPLPLTWEGLGIADDTTKVYVEGDEIKAWNLRDLGLTRLPKRFFDMQVGGLDLHGNPIRCKHCRERGGLVEHCVEVGGEESGVGGFLRGFLRRRRSESVIM